jgi:hypothetical protein
MGGGGEPWKGDVIVVIVAGGGDGEGPMRHWEKLGGTRDLVRFGKVGRDKRD